MGSKTNRPEQFTCVECDVIAYNISPINVKLRKFCSPHCKEKYYQKKKKYMRIYG